MDGIHITDIETAINFWRERKPSPDGGGEAWRFGRHSERAAQRLAGS
jgi:hypothetical protein